MFRLLLKLFADNRQKYGILAGITGILANTILFITKIVIGSISASISITADAFNNLGDAVSSVISILGFKMSGRNPDKEHPFGHGRSEYIAGFLVAVLIFLVGIEFIKSSFLRIINPQPIEFDIYMLIILGISILIKLWMWSYNNYAGRKIESKTLLAAAKDSLNDSLITLATVISMILSKYIVIDGYIGVLISIFIIYSGIQTLKETLSPLLGEAADPDTIKNIENILTGYESIIAVHDFILHNYGHGRRMATIHVEVSNTSDIVVVHNMIDKAERRILDELGIFIVIHVDPVPVNDKKTNNARMDVCSVIADIDIELKIHDFRLVEGDVQKNLIFDLVVPFSYQESGKNELINKISLKLKEIDEKYNPVITLDHAM